MGAYKYIGFAQDKHFVGEHTGVEEYPLCDVVYVVQGVPEAVDDKVAVQAERES